VKFAQKGEKAPGKRLLARDQVMISPAVNIASGNVYVQNRANELHCKVLS